MAIVGHSNKLDFQCWEVAIEDCMKKKRLAWRKVRSDKNQSVYTVDRLSKRRRSCTPGCDRTVPVLEMEASIQLRNLDYIVSKNLHKGKATI